MKLKEFNFNSIKRIRSSNLCIMEECLIGREPGRRYESLTIGETLRAIPIEWAEREIKETRWFFDTFVIELKGRTTGLIDKTGKELLEGDIIEKAPSL